MRKLPILILLLFPLFAFTQTAQLIRGDWVNYPNVHNGTELTFVRPQSLGAKARLLNPRLQWEVEEYGLMNIERGFSNYPTTDGVQEDPKPTRTIQLKIMDGDTVVVEDAERMVYNSGISRTDTFWKLSEDGKTLRVEGEKKGQTDCYRILSISATEMKLRKISYD